jgi:fatty acid desaturase
MTTAEVAATVAAERRGGMVPDAAHLPDVLPTDRLSTTGKPHPALRADLRRPHGWRNAGNVVAVWLQTAGLLVVASRLAERVPAWMSVPMWAVVFLLMGRGLGLFAILGHEGAHRLLFRDKRLNDAVSKWLVAYPAFLPLDLYRRSHFAHHREEFGPAEPDLSLYNGYPITKASMRRKLWRDARGTTGWKNLRALLLALRSRFARPVALRILGVQVVIAVGLTLATGLWWVYPVMWLAPWMTVWRVLNRLRAIAEHGGMTASTDRRVTTHVIRQSRAARFWLVPFNTGWHLAHHVDMGVPFQNLPALHDELVASGWITPELEHRSYTELWRALSSG